MQIFERTLQTIAVVIGSSMAYLGGFGFHFVFLILFVFSPDWIKLVLLVYLIFIYFDSDVQNTGGRRKLKALWNSRLWGYMCDYFPTKLIKTAELEPSRNHILVAFPHGILPLGMGCALSTTGAKSDKLFPGISFTLLSLNFHFFVPFFREYVLGFGTCAASAKSISYLLSEGSRSGRALVLLAGGASEAMYSEPGTYRILLKRRRGFVKLALQHGTPLVPVFTFGENDYFDQVNFPDDSIAKRFQNFVKDLTGLLPIVIGGAGLFGILPRRTPINIVVGSPIEVPKVTEPSSEQIDKYHAIFTEKLVELFETHKSKYVENHEDVKLQLIE